MDPASASPGFHRAALSPREALLFEAGVKLGGVFHQYLGMPVSAETASGLSRTIERAVALQPFVTAVSVKIDTERGPSAGTGHFAYQYLTPEMLAVEVTLQDGTTTVVAGLDHRADLNYPLMSVLSVDTLEADGRLRDRSST
ncbi:MAG TPA: dihydroneopterin aldolase family protein [Thermoplasmata archaeon]